MTLTFGSLFAGIGGFDLGFERAGMVCKWQVEIDDYANRVLAKHWPNVRRWPDVRTWPQPDTERVDVVCGGFPCQDISYAGQGAGLDGERSGLFFEAVRVVRELRPRIVVLENVAALLTRGLDRVLGTLAEIGYDAEWHCIPAAAFGADHLRERIFVIAYPNGVGWRIVRKLQPANKKNEKRESCDLWGKERCDWNGNIERLFLDVLRRSNASSCKRIPDGVSGSVDELRGLGNAVVPQVAEWIGRRIVESIR